MVQALRSEEAAVHEGEQSFDDEVLFDLKCAWVSGCVGGALPAAGGEAAAVVVGALLMGALHAPPAQRAANAATQCVDAPCSSCAPSWVVSGRLFGRDR